MTVAESALGQGSCWNSTSLSERGISIGLQNILNWKGPENYQIQLSRCIPGFPFAELPPHVSSSNKAQALLCYDRQHSVFHMTAQVCAFTMTSQLAEEMVEQYLRSSLPKFRAGDLHPPRFMVWMSASGYPVMAKVESAMQSVVRSSLLRWNASMIS